MKVRFQNIKHIFWDWNGTLLDDSRLCSSIINGILAKNGLGELSYEQYRQTFDFPVKKYYERLGLEEKGVSFDQTSREFIESYNDRWEICCLQPNAKKVLQSIKKLGISQSVISAGEQNLLHGFVKHHKLQGFFDDLVGVDHIYASGKLERAIEYAKSLNVKNDEVLMIGDTVHDHEVAMAVGAHVLLYTKGHHPKQKLEELKCPVISCLSNVLKYIQQSARR